MKKIFGFLILIALLCPTFKANAQTDGIVFSLMPHMPFNNYLNPGVRVPYNGIVGFGFSHINVATYNSSVRYSNIYAINGNGEEVIDGVKLVNSLHEQENYFNVDMSMDLINAGFRIKKLFFNIDWRMKLSTDFQFSKDFIGFFILGNGNYLGPDNPCDFNIGINATTYLEYGLGVQYDVNDHLTVGIRPKFLSGIANASLNNKETKIYTDANTYAISADVELDIKMASILESDLSRISDISKIFNNVGSNGKMVDVKENTGFGIDLGASYKFNEKWGVAASIYDIGYITWRDAKVKKLSKSDVSINEQLVDDYNDLQHLELDYNGMVDDVIKEVWGNDSLVGGEEYKTSLKTRFIMQGYYELNPMVRFSAIGQLCTTLNGTQPAFTLAYSGAYWDHLNFALSYTYSKYTGNAVGMGFGIHAGPVNMYVASDNILAFTKMSAPLVEFATTYKTANVRFGFVWTIGKYQGTKKAEVAEEVIVEEEVNIDTEAIDKAEEEYMKELEERKKAIEEPEDE